jgi:DNA-3-methyladenine glycosylase II
VSKGFSRRGSIASLTEEVLSQGVRVLCRRDPDLRRVVKQFGPPPLWAREPGFSTLIHIILEQQVSLASARAAHNRLIELARPLTPRRFLRFDDATLKTCGFSRQKTAYCRHLAESIMERSLDLEALASLDDDAVKSELEKIKGIGRWTSDIYLLMVLRRPDIWPRGDLALAAAAHEVKQLERRPTQDDLDSLSLAWKPWRAVAARILWHHYLSRRTSSGSHRRPRS